MEVEFRALGSSDLRTRCVSYLYSVLQPCIFFSSHTNEPSRVKKLVGGAPACSPHQGYQASIR